MPGSSRNPVRPRHTLTLSRDRLGLSNGAGIVGLLFGSIFTMTGILAIYVSVSPLGMVFGLGASHADDAFVNQPLWQSLVGLAVVLLIGVGHLSVGSLLLTTWRAKIDRIKGTVTVRYGWMGLWKTDAALSEFDEVTVFPGGRWWYRFGGEPVFEISLVGPAHPKVVVGFATRSPELAREVAEEVGRFTGLRLA